MPNVLGSEEQALVRVVVGDLDEKQWYVAAVAIEKLLSNDAAPPAEVPFTLTDEERAQLQKYLKVSEGWSETPVTETWRGLFRKVLEASK